MLTSISEKTVSTKMSEGTVLAKICSFVEERFLVDKGTLTNDLDLFDQGIVDSFGLIEIVAFLESTFAVVLEREELMSARVATVGGIASLVAEKQAVK
jgi:acyl carrier protein